MGRIAAYLGPRLKIASVVEDGSYALLRQATDRPDGFGLGWYPGDGDRAAVRVLAERPIYPEDPSLDVARRYSSECVVAAVRSQRGREQARVQPLQSGPYLFASDGSLERYSEVYLRPLRERLTPGRYAEANGGDESDLLFCTWLDALGDQQGPDAMANALESLVSAVQAIGAPANANASFAIVVSDGTCLVTLRTATKGSPPALFTIVAGESAPFPATGRVVATEPLFQGAWSSLDPHSLVIFTVEGT